MDQTYLVIALCVLAAAIFIIVSGVGKIEFMIQELRSDLEQEIYFTNERLDEHTGKLNERISKLEKTLDRLGIRDPYED